MGFFMSFAETQKLLQARAGGKVERCHGIPHHGSYSNAAHQHGVALIMFYLWPEHFSRLAIYCLTHDTPEFIFGDIPAPTLRYVSGFRGQLEELEATYSRSIGLPAEVDLSHEDHAMLKACDVLEFYLWCREQEAQGNRYVEEALSEVKRFMNEKPLPQRAQDFFQYYQAFGVLPEQAGVAKRLAGSEL